MIFVFISFTLVLKLLDLVKNFAAVSLAIRWGIFKNLLDSGISFNVRMINSYSDSGLVPYPDKTRKYQHNQ